MCLLTVYEKKNGAESLVLEHVSAIVTEDGAITVTDIMGGTVVIPGIIRRIDMDRSAIFIEAPSMVAQ